MQLDRLESNYEASSDGTVDAGWAMNLISMKAQQLTSPQFKVYVMILCKMYQGTGSKPISKQLLQIVCKMDKELVDGVIDLLLEKELIYEYERGYYANL